MAVTDDDAVEVRRRRAVDEVAVSVRRSEPTPRGAALLLGGARHALSGPRTIVGRAADADVRLNVDGLEGHHLLIERRGEVDVAVPLSRRTGTFVNGDILLVPTILEAGAALDLAAGASLRYVPAAGADLPLARVTPVDAGAVSAGREAVTLGRDERCTMVLDHPTVARLHAVIRTADGTSTVEAASGHAVVRVNGEVTRRSPVRQGDVISIGPFRIVFDGATLVEGGGARGLSVAAVGLTARVGDRTLLQPLDLALHPGELVAVIGSSGAGKSTLLKALAGVTRASGGSVLLGGEDVGLRVGELGYVPQFDIVHGELTVREALTFGATLRLPADTTPPERSRRVGEVMEELSLADRADVRVDRLSGGQRKRVAVALELLHRPAALFLDEPTTGLDPALERRSMELYRELADTGQTVVLVTHAVTSLDLCDRLVVMGRGGHLCFSGPPEQARDFFGASSYEQLYLEVEDADTEALARRARAASPPTAPPAGWASRASGQRAPVSRWTQFGVLLQRSALLLVRDGRHLLGAAAQVPVLAVMAALLFGPDVLRGGGRPDLDAAKAAQLAFLLVTIAVWFGSIAAAREIVKERELARRERDVGVAPAVYLGVKTMVLGGLASAQALVLVAIVLAMRPTGLGWWPEVALVLSVCSAAWIGVLLGLLVSALARTEDQAAGVVPLLLVPQLLLGGAIVSIHEMTAPMQVLSAVVPTRWSFAAAGDQLGLQERLDGAGGAAAELNRYGPGFFELPVGLYCLVVAAFVAVLWLGVLHALRRGDR